LFSFVCFLSHHDPHSFPTRRSSDLTALITLGTVFLNTVSFNRFNSHWGVDISNLNNSGKSLLTYGYESRQISDWSMKFRWNISRSEEHTSELQSRENLVCRLLLEKK